ncbi:MAG: hypothetical protein HRU09_14165 [Oligoflexales bacterium]|nr:hypothetical protein [Oligoflexales bacterium]
MYQFFTRVYFFLLTSMFCFSCNIHVAIADSETSSKKPDYIINECSVIQGNGADWAAIFGWLAEDLLVKAEKAEKYERDHPRSIAGIKFSCMIGGSSGSASTMVLLQLLKNKQLGLKFLGKHTIGASDARLLGRALRIIAYSVDLTFKEKRKFIKHALRMVLWSYPVDALKSVVLAEKFPDRWAFKLLDGNYIFFYFANSLLFARYITRELVNLDISMVFAEKHIRTAKKYGLSKLGDLLQLPTHAIPLEDEQELTKIFEMHGKKIVKLARRFIVRNLKPKTKWRHLNRDAMHDGPMFDVLNEPLEDGFCTISMTDLWWGESKNIYQKSLSYEHMRPMVMCNESTIKKMLASKLYREHIEKGYPYASRFILGVVKTVRGSISSSIREPWLMASLSGPPNENELEIDSIYDPEIDLKINGKRRYKAVSAEGFLLNGRHQNIGLGIIGGFADRRIAAWMMSYYYLDKIEELEQSKLSSKNSLTMFGLPDERKLDKFDTYLIKNDLAGSGHLAEQYLKDWSLFQFNWFETFKLIFHRKKVLISMVAFNFDLSVIPAAIDRKSRYLVPMAANITRLQLFAFDSSIKRTNRYFEPDIKLKFPNKKTGAYWVYEFGPEDPLDPNLLVVGDGNPSPPSDRNRMF